MGESYYGHKDLEFFGVGRILLKVYIGILFHGNVEPFGPHKSDLK